MSDLFKCDCLAINWKVTAKDNRLCFECQSCGNKFFKKELNLNFKTGIQELIKKLEGCEKQ